MADSFVNSSFPPRRLEVEGWGFLGPGERALGVEPTDHNKGLVDTGDLTRIREEAALKSLEQEQGSRNATPEPKKGDK